MPQNHYNPLSTEDMEEETTEEKENNPKKAIWLSG